MCKQNLYPYEWFCTWPWFEKEAKNNSVNELSVVHFLLKNNTFHFHLQDLNCEESTSSLRIFSFQHKNT